MSEHTIEKAYKPEGYTDADQRSDTSFLVGVNYGWSMALREAEKRLAEIAWADWALAGPDAGQDAIRIVREVAALRTPPGAS